MSYDWLSSLLYKIAQLIDFKCIVEVRNGRIVKVDFDTLKGDEESG